MRQEEPGKAARSSSQQPRGRQHLLQNEDWRKRAEAIATLAKSTKEEAVLVLADSLSDPYVHVRVKALEALAQSRHPQAAAFLASALDNGMEEVRRISARLLQPLEQTILIDPLIEVMRTGYHRESRLLAAEKLGAMGAEKAIEPLIELLDEASAALRARALDSLVKLTEVPKDRFGTDSDKWRQWLQTGAGRNATTSHEGLVKK